MLRLVIILVLLIASVWLGLTVVKHPGYMLLVYKPWMVQMPLWFAVLGLIVFLIIFYFLISSIDRFKFWSLRVKNWWHLRKEHKLYSKTQQGLTALIEGHWRLAEQLLLSGVTQTVDPLVNYLGAAKAAQELGAFERRDQYLRTAHEITPDAEMAIGLTQADLEIEEKQYEQAVATLNSLRNESPNQPRVLKLLEKVYVRTADWSNLQKLIPALRKAKLISNDEAMHFEKNVYCERLSSTHVRTAEEVNNIWQSIPRAMKKNAEATKRYIMKLANLYDGHMTVEQTTELEDLIQKSLKSQYIPELVAVYRQLPLNNLNRQLVVAGTWLKKYGYQSEILLTLGKVCARIKLWGKAKDYFEKCLEIGPNPEASLEYGKLLEQLGEETEALDKYRQGLEACSNHLTNMN